MTGGNIRRKAFSIEFEITVNLKKKQVLVCSRLSVSEDDRKSERATSGISCERDPGVKRRGCPLYLCQSPIIDRPYFRIRPN